MPVIRPNEIETLTIDDIGSFRAADIEWLPRRLTVIKEIDGFWLTDGACQHPASIKTSRRPRYRRHVPWVPAGPYWWTRVGDNCTYLVFVPIARRGEPIRVRVARVRLKLQAKMVMVA